MLTSSARLCRPCRLAGPAHAAATAGFSIQEGEIPRETDCLLEGSGFEPSVPLPRFSSIRAVRAEIIGRRADFCRRDREFDFSALQGRLSTSSQSQCSTDPGLIAGTWHRPLFLTRDRWFESGSLQRRVRLSPRAAVEGREPRLSARLCAAGLATGSAETR